jgi:uncharacterized protein YjdB
MRKIIAIVCALIVELGCSDAKSLTDPTNTSLNQATAKAVVVSLQPATVSAPVGDSVQVSASSNGSAVAGSSMVWSAADTTVAKVSANGTVHLKKAGSTKVFAVSGKDTASAAVTVQPSNTVAAVQVSPSTASLTVGGATTTLTATAANSAGTALSGQTFAWASSNASIATVAAGSTAGTGIVTVVAAGSVTITATSGGKAATATLTVAAAAAAAPVHTGTEFGVHSDLTYNGNASYHTQGVTALTAMHATVSRNSFLWHQIEATQGTYNWSVVDDVVGKLQAANIDPLMVVYGSPAWANGTSSSTSDYYLQVPQDSAAFAQWVSQYAAFMGVAAARYAGKVNKWEIGNEENQHYFWQPKPNVQQFITWFSAVYSAVKAANPQATVAVGGLIGLCCGPTGDYTGEAFLQDLYNAGLKFDAVAVHPYPSESQAPDSTIQWQNNFTDIAVVHNLMVSNGGANTPMWVTEWGWSTSTISAATAATYITKSLNMIATQYTYVTVATYFQIQDLPTQYYYGLYDTNWNLKPTGTAFAAFTASLSH